MLIWGEAIALWWMIGFKRPKKKAGAESLAFDWSKTSILNLLLKVCHVGLKTSDFPTLFPPIVAAPGSPALYLCTHIWHTMRLFWHCLQHLSTGKILIHTPSYFCHQSQKSSFPCTTFRLQVQNPNIQFRALRLGTLRCPEFLSIKAWHLSSYKQFKNTILLFWFSVIEVAF